MQHSGFKGQLFTGNSWSCFCEALSSNSQPLPDSAWLHNNSPLEPQQCLCTSARGQRTNAPSLCSQAQLRHTSLTWEPSCCAGPSRPHTGPLWDPQRYGEISNSVPKMQECLIQHTKVLRQSDAKTEPCCSTERAGLKLCCQPMRLCKATSGAGATSTVKASPASNRSPVLPHMTCLLVPSLTPPLRLLHSGCSSTSFRKHGQAVYFFVWQHGC